MRVAIVGAGLAGLCAAWGLLEEQAGEITVFEREDGPGLATSYANGALLHPSAVDPWNSPGILRVLLASLGRPEAAVLLRARALPSLLGWGLRFLRESSPARHRARTLANVALALNSVALMRTLRACGVEYGASQRGSLMTYRDAAAFDRARDWARMLGEHGVASTALSREQLVALEPALGAVAPQLVGALHNTSDEAGDAQRFCVALAARLQAQGVALRFGSPLRALDGDAAAVRGVVLADGAVQRFDAVVLATAVWTAALAAPLGLRLPVRPVKGYSLTLPLPAAGPRPGVPVIDNALHVAAVPLADGQLRVAGTAEFCGMDTRIDPARVANLTRQLHALYPEVAATTPPQAARAWAGLRPMCVDGSPLIGPTQVKGLYLNTGHGQLGWTTAAASGQLLARLLVGRAPDLDARPFAPARFGL